MPWDAGNAGRSRRNVLKSVAKAGVGASILLTGGSSAVAAMPECAVADGDDGDATVYENCGTDPVAEVPNGETAVTRRVCIDDDGNQVLYLVWDGDWPNGWVYASETGSCDPAEKHS
jgi:hypothetical protein